MFFNFKKRLKLTLSFIPSSPPEKTHHYTGCLGHVGSSLAAISKKIYDYVLLPLGQIVARVVQWMYVTVLIPMKDLLKAVGNALIEAVSRIYAYLFLNTVKTVALTDDSIGALFGKSHLSAHQAHREIYKDVFFNMSVCQTVDLQENSLTLEVAFKSGFFYEKQCEDTAFSFCIDINSSSKKLVVTSPFMWDSLHLRCSKGNLDKRGQPLMEFLAVLLKNKKYEDYDIFFQLQDRDSPEELRCSNLSRDAFVQLSHTGMDALGWTSIDNSFTYSLRREAMQAYGSKLGGLFDPTAII